MRVELARLFEPARPGSSQLDFSCQLDRGRASLTRVEPARLFEPARPGSSQLDFSSWLDRIELARDCASSTSVDLARRTELARLRSSQLDLSSQLGRGRASSTFRASSTGVEPARLFEPARPGAYQAAPWLDGASTIQSASSPRASLSAMGRQRRNATASPRRGSNRIAHALGHAAEAEAAASCSRAHGTPASAA